jgi:two-component system NarL family response regulator
MQTSRIRVLLADEQSLFREAMRSVLDNEDDIEVVADAGNGFSAIAEAGRMRPDVAVLDAGLQNCSGIRAAEKISEHTPECRVIVMSAEENDEILLQAVKAGASAYITKSAPLVDLIEGVRATHRGETVVPPLMLGRLLERLVRRRHEEDEALRLIGKLTPREREVLELLAQGADNEKIAVTLVISPQTARTHVQNIVSKLGLHSRLEAAMFARKAGIVEDLIVLDEAEPSSVRRS